MQQSSSDSAELDGYCREKARRWVCLFSERGMASSFQLNSWQAQVDIADSYGLCKGPTSVENRKVDRLIPLTWLQSSVISTLVTIWTVQHGDRRNDHFTTIEPSRMLDKHVCLMWKEQISLMWVWMRVSFSTRLLSAFSQRRGVWKCCLLRTKWMEGRVSRPWVIFKLTSKRTWKVSCWN